MPESQFYVAGRLPDYDKICAAGLKDQKFISGVHSNFQLEEVYTDLTQTQVDSTHGIFNGKLLSLQAFSPSGIPLY